MAQQRDELKSATEEITRLLKKAVLANAKEADQRKDHFLAMLAHELRNPLCPFETRLKFFG